MGLGRARCGARALTATAQSTAEPEGYAFTQPQESPPCLPLKSSATCDVG